MSRTAQRARMDEYAIRDLRDTAWNRNIDAVQSTIAEIDATYRAEHAAGMASLDACIAAIEELGKNHG